MGSRRPPARLSGAPAGPEDMDRALAAVVRLLTAGEVVSYGDVADDAGFPGRARAVGRLLATTDADLPWWRVVTASGRLVPGLEREHRALLAAEGVAVRGNRVVRAPRGRFSRPAAPGPTRARTPSGSG